VDDTGLKRLSHSRKLPMSHIPASAMPHAAPKHHDDEPQAEAIGSPATAPDQAPAALSPSPAS